MVDPVQPLEYETGLLFMSQLACRATVRKSRTDSFSDLSPLLTVVSKNAICDRGNSAVNFIVGKKSLFKCLVVLELEH